MNIKKVIGVLLFVAASVVANAQYSGVIRALNDAGVIGEIKRDGNSLKISDSLVRIYMAGSRDTLGRIYNLIGSKDSSTDSRRGVVILNTVPVSGTVTSTSDSSTGSRKGVVLLTNPAITNDSTTLSRRNVQVTNTVAVSGTVTSSDSSRASRKGVVLLANPTISNDSSTLSRRNVQVTNSLTVSGHDSTTDSRKGVVLLVNPTIANDSTTMSRKSVQLDSTTTSHIENSRNYLETLSNNVGQWDNLTWLGNDVLDSVPVRHQQIKDSLSLIRTQLRNELVAINNNTINNAMGTRIRDSSGYYIKSHSNALDVWQDSALARKGVVLLTNPTITNDSSTVSRKGVVTLNNVQVQGTVATDVAITANPLNLGAQAVSSENTAVTTARQVQLVADLVGKLITLPYANPENFISGSTSAITDTTSTSVIAAGGSGVRNYITSILVTNSHATVSTFVKILDGTTTLWQGYALAAGGGFSVTFPVPLRGTANTAINAKCVTTGSNVIVNCAGYKGR